MSDEPPPNDRERFRRVVRLAADYLGLLGVLGVLILFFSLKSERFLSAETFSMLANQVPTLTVIAAGMTFVLVVAGIDLSVGSVMALCGAVLGVAMVDHGWPMPWSVALCLATGLGCGLVNGLITVRWAIPSFIVTLGMLEMTRGGAYLVTHSETKFIGADIEPIAAPIAAPMAGGGLSPAFFLAILVVLLGQFTLTRTRFGRYVIAVGANQQAARLSGIDPRRIKVIVFAMAGLMAGLGGWFQTSRMATADPNAGVGLELSAIAAVVIGGTSLMGGRGSVINSFFGVLIIAVLESGLASIGAADPTKRLVTGAVIVIAVIADTYRHRLTK